jgi:hypothetical protein
MRWQLPIGTVITLVVALTGAPATQAAGADDGLGPIDGVTAPRPATDPQPPDMHPMARSDDHTTATQLAAMSAAAKQARETGKPVAVAALTTETQQTLAQPGGGFAYVANTRPVRARKDGRWQSLDLSLRRRTDGSLSPVATAYGDVRFSGGGIGPVAVTTYGKARYAVSWPGKLPAPRVSGDTATYANVLPGVDLAVRATDTGGFSEVLVVKSAQAAADPALAHLDLNTAMSAARPVRSEATDGVAVSAGDGGTLNTGTPLMWDSHSAAGDRSDMAHAGVAARVAVVRASAGAKSLTLMPDRGLLTAKSTVYPVYIDPTFNWHPASAAKPAFDEVKSGSPCNGASYYDNTGSAGNYGQLGVGYNGWPSGCIGREHAYYQWAIPKVIWGSSVHSATVDATEVYASSCGSTSTVNLHWTGGINSGTDWNNKPGYVANGLNTSHSFAPAYNGNACPNNDPVTHGFNVLSPIAKAASAHTGSFTAVLTQDSTESSKDRNAFKRFSDNPSLQIQYDRTPTTPAGMSAVTGSNSSGCATATPYPFVGKTIATNTPTLTAKVADPDGDALRATFKYWVDGSSTNASGLSGDNLASNSTAKFSLPSTFTKALTNGQIVDWQVQATDGQLTSGWTAVCHFIAEPTAPSQPTVTTADNLYPDQDQDATADQIGAAAGTAGKFTLTNTGTTATKFIYNLDVPPATANPPAAQTIAASGNTATVTVTPKVPGPHTLWVAAVDAAGDSSSMAAYRFEADHLPATTCATFAACLNNVAITADTNTTPGNADGANSLSATDLTNAGWTSGGRVTVDGTTVTLPAFGSGQNDNVLSAGQTLTYNYTAPATGSSSLLFLANATNATSADPGSIDGDATAPYVPAGIGVAGVYCFSADDPAAFCAPQGSINYTDGTSKAFYLTVPDWNAGPADLAAVVLPHRNGQAGQVAKPEKIYPFTVPVDASKTIGSIQLPEVGLGVGTLNQALHIFGIGTRNTTAGTIETNGSTAPAAAGTSWTGAWASPTEVDGNYNANSAAFSNQTFRVALKPSISGNTMRIKLDNALNPTKLVIGHATVALDAGAPPNAAPSGAFHNLTFGAAAGTTIPAGAMVYSDPLAFTITANTWLLVSFDITNSAAFIPEHSFASDTDATFVSAPGSGDLTTSTDTTEFNPSDTTGAHAGNFTDILTDLDVTTAGFPTQVVLGDGLVDAWQPKTAPEDQTGSRLSDDLAAAEPSTPFPYGTLAEGVESNYVMTDDPQVKPNTTHLIGGPSALSRIDRDVLDQPGVNTVVLDEGLEDILHGSSSDDLASNGYTELLSYLQANNINTIALGLHPCDGYAGDGATGADDPCTAAVDGERTAVNGWLSSGPLNMTPATFPALYYIDPDATIGVPDTANGETKLDPNAAIAVDHVNLNDSGFAALATAYLGAQDSWTLNDGDTDPAAPAAADNADNDSNPYLANNPNTGQAPATLTATGATWTTDATRGPVLALDGTSGGATTAGPVLDTGHSYSVSAWAKLSSNAATATVVTQEDSTNAPFSLRYDKTLNAWTFSVSTTSTGTTATTVHGAAPALNTWTHLVGTYNAASHVMALYVNGTSVGTASFTTPWASTGTLDLGHAAATGWFPGSLSSVQAWNYALAATQVKALDQQIS